MIKIVLIRHGMTEGNLKKRYIGTTDEPLCKEGIMKIEECCRRDIYPDAERIFASSKKRCIETAELIYPGRTFQVMDNLSECDFGLFENKNYLELSGCPSIRSGSTVVERCRFLVVKAEKYFRKGVSRHLKDA